MQTGPYVLTVLRYIMQVYASKAIVPIVMTSSTSSMSTGFSSPCSSSSPIMMSVLLGIFSRWVVPLHVQCTTSPLLIACYTLLLLTAAALLQGNEEIANTMCDGPIFMVALVGCARDRRHKNTLLLWLAWQQLVLKHKANTQLLTSNHKTKRKPQAVVEVKGFCNVS